MTDARPRIVSLVPSSTETLLALGADVVACTRFCEQPELPHVGGTKNPDLDAIVGLAPDLVVLDREENRREDHDALVAAGLRVLATDITSLDGARDVVGLLASAADLPEPVPPPIPAAVVERRTAFVPIWRRPWMTIGPSTYGASLLDHLGVDLVPVTTEAYPTVELPDVAAAGPEVILLPSEPYEFRDAHLEELASAMPGTPIQRVDGQDLFWWGVRTPAALTRLSAALERPPTA